MRDLFLIDPSVTFLNHGSFGATPRPVFEAYQEWQRRLEWEPVQFMMKLGDYFTEARGKLAAYVNCDPMDVAFVPNATTGVNIVARSLGLGPGDEVLSTNHEYGACENGWVHAAEEKGFTYIRQPISLPVTSNEQLLAALWAGVTPNTKLIYLSHITSATALTFPVAEICARARAQGILTFIDGAHAPGQIDLDLIALDADFYTGNLHKWLCAPKGAAFLYTRRDQQEQIKPIVVGWGMRPNKQLEFGSPYLDALQFLGTDDPAAYLAVPDAIDFQAGHDWPAVRENCHTLLVETLHRIYELTDQPPLYPDGQGFYRQMACAALPATITDGRALSQRLFSEYRIEIPVFMWEGHAFIRPSFQGYNTAEDAETLLQALREILQGQVA